MVRLRARPDNWLATMPVMRNAPRAIQFCGSAIVTRPTGGRKKTFRHTVAVTAAAVDSTMPHRLAMSRIAIV